MSESILTESDDGVLLVTINNPNRKNALSPSMGLDLIEVFRDAAADPGVRVVILTGAGDAFCAGGDIGKFWAVDARDKVGMAWADHPVWSEPEQRVSRSIASSEMSILLHEMGKPTIAMVRGPAAGAGLSMALACDFRIASETAIFTTAFAKIGTSGDLGMANYLTKLVGPTVARSWLLFSEKIGARQALEAGLVSVVTPDDGLETTTMTWARRLASGPAVAFRHIKQNLRFAEDGNSTGYFELEAANMIRCLQTEDAQNAMQAFAEKRTPRFAGR